MLGLHVGTQMVRLHIEQTGIHDDNLRITCIFMDCELFWGPVRVAPLKFESAALFLRKGLPSTLIRHENAALFLRLGLPSTLIRHENAALFLRLDLPSTLIRHLNAALFLRLGLPSTLIRHENGAFWKHSSQTH